MFVRELGQALVEHHAVFEGGVHPLTIERDNRVRSIAYERDLVFVVPGRATDRH